MSVLDDLIQIKKMSQKDDLIKILEEVDTYEKLSADKSLRDLSTSEITRKKCPLLASMADGNAYERILGDLAANVYLQVEEQIPEVLRHGEEMKEKQKRQLDVLQSSVVDVEYRDLSLYVHASMKDQVVAVFTFKYPHAPSAVAVIIVKTDSGYSMYHGTYETDVKESDVKSEALSPVQIKGRKGVLTLYTYSMLGNNAYPFARYTDEKGIYQVMLSLDGILYLIKDGAVSFEHVLTLEEKNELAAAKETKTIFSEAVLGLIENVV